MPEIFLLLGSNLGDRFEYLREASRLINTKIGEITSISSYYETSAWGLTDQPDFINQAIRLSSFMPAVKLLEVTKSIEQDLERERVVRWGPRTIDIDILFYGSEILNLSELTIPHKLLHERRFVLMPVHEIAPDLIHPVLNKTIDQLLSEVADDLSVRKIRN